MTNRRQQAIKSLALIFVLIQAVLILLGSLNRRPWYSWGRAATVIEAYGSLTSAAQPYFFFAPAVHPQWFAQVHAAGPPVYDEVLGAHALTQDGALKVALVGIWFVHTSNVPLFLECVSRQFFERHPGYDTVTVTFGYYNVPSLAAWKRGERTSMTKSMEMTFRRLD
jgi:hypothetical protein